VMHRGSWCIVAKACNMWLGEMSYHCKAWIRHISLFLAEYLEENLNHNEIKYPGVVGYHYAESMIETQSKHKIVESNIGRDDG
jgi:hypothetical protein